MFEYIISYLRNFRYSGNIHYCMSVRTYSYAQILLQVSKGLVCETKMC